jgi:type I restriction enzyme S subunit
MSKKIASEMNEISLTDAVSFVVDNRGKTVPVAEDGTGITLIATNCISNEHLYPLKLNVRYVSKEIFESWFRAHPKPDDIIITNKGSNNGEVCLVPDPVDFCIAQDMVALRADSEEIYPYYLFASLRSSLVQRRIKRLNVDAVIPHFKKTDFDKLFIPLPPEETQKFIGDLYVLLSRKIENLRKQNETLERIAQTLFKHWFVDFEFPNEDGKPYKSSGGEMVRSELGEIPEGWQVRKFGELGELNRGKSKHRPRYAEHLYGGMYPFIQTGDVKESQGFITEYQQTYSEDGLAQSRLWYEETLCITIAANIAETGILSFPSCFPDSVIGFVADSSICDVYFIHRMFKNKRQEIENEAIGSVQKNLNLETIARIKFVVPDLRSHKESVLLFRNFGERIIANKQQIQTLTKTRDVLLPQLMSGKLRIKD